MAVGGDRARAAGAGDPIAVSLVQDPGEIALGIWSLGIAFPWLIGRAAARQQELALELDATRAELAKQALVAERRQIARDVHDVVGHGIAALMLQIISARHVLRRDPAAAEDALRSAEDVGRRSMQELRRTVAVLRHEGDELAAAPLPSARAIPALVEDARSGGLSVELRTRGDLSRITPSVGAALYRTQEALANATRHAPRARTVFALEVTNGRASLSAETRGPTIAPAAGEHGYGLIGMRERATGLGGEFRAGPTPEGWLVSCRLPLHAQAEGRRRRQDDDSGGARRRPGDGPIRPRPDPLARRRLRGSPNARMGARRSRSCPSAPGRDPDGHPDAEARRDRGDRAAPHRRRSGAGARADDVRGGRGALGVLEAAPRASCSRTARPTT